MTAKKRHALEEASLKWAKPLIEQSQLAPKQEESLEKKEPHMLHVVYRIKTVRGRPWWEKELIEKLELDGPCNRPVIHKNIPEINKMLREVKHLVRIVPLTFPHGLPEHESDFDHTLVKSNGEFVVQKRLEHFEPESVDETNKWELAEETVKSKLTRTLQTFSVHREYNRAKYEYKYNQDGKEFRYNFNKPQKQ
ncbi:hypothetical protein NP493_402g04000 [Ridgeia piscesae]|uniref:Large ribosomal subunit protein uL30m n=1 Tax=Ridgeia piscesae TaxID=27915 RepID=A0AAD9NSZ5_RIDPI|nr:hypothetical protein NP493_402g04000 [Ridgeia piscesae]